MINLVLVCGYSLYGGTSGLGYEMNCGLRPVISINLVTSGYNMEKIEDKDNGISFKLSKNQA